MFVSGVILRDSHGVAQVRFVTGNKILRILKSKGLAPDLPEDLYHLIKKAVAVRKHLERNRKVSANQNRNSTCVFFFVFFSPNNTGVPLLLLRTDSKTLCNPDPRHLWRTPPLSYALVWITFNSHIF